MAAIGFFGMSITCIVQPGICPLVVQPPVVVVGDEACVFQVEGDDEVSRAWIVLKDGGESEVEVDGTLLRYNCEHQNELTTVIAELEDGGEKYWPTVPLGGDNILRVSDATPGRPADPSPVERAPEKVIAPREKMVAFDGNATNQPGWFGASCSSCGGKVQCEGTCSAIQPTNLNGKCNSCGGKVLYDGTCSAIQPTNFGASCNSFGGTVRCDGTCSDFDVPTLTSNFSCGVNLFETSICHYSIEAPCPAGSEAAGHCKTPLNLSGKGNCFFVAGSESQGDAVARAVLRMEIGAANSNQCQVAQCYCRHQTP